MINQLNRWFYEWCVVVRHWVFQIRYFFKLMTVNVCLKDSMRLFLNLRCWRCFEYFYSSWKFITALTYKKIAFQRSDSKQSVAQLKETRSRLRFGGFNTTLVKVYFTCIAGLYFQLLAGTSRRSSIERIDQCAAVSACAQLDCWASSRNKTRCND